VHARTTRKRSAGWVVAMVVRGGGSAPSRRNGECRTAEVEDGGREKSAAATEAADYAEGQSSVRG